MKKMMGVFAAVAVLVILLTGCHNSSEDNGTDKSDPDPSVSDSQIVQDTDDVFSSDSSQTVPTTDSEVPDITTEDHTQDTSAVVTEDNDPIDSSNKIVQTAEMLLGIPFAENGISPETGFDNSGFIYYVLRENGFINCPRLTGDQAVMGTRIDYDQLKSGDLAFFSTAESGNPDFGGIYIGQGKMIYCPMPGQNVKIADITVDYWKRTFVSGVSLS